VPILGLIKNFQQFRLFFTQKIEKIAYSRNCKETPNIQSSITSFLYKISTHFLCVWLGFPGWRIPHAI